MDRGMGLEAVNKVASNEARPSRDEKFHGASSVPNSESVAKREKIGLSPQF